MAHTNSTTNYNLPQFIATDKPAWLTDINSAFNTIDIETKRANDNASLAKTKAETALTASETATTSTTQALTSITALQTTVGNASSGLVKEVNDLKLTVGDTTSGLVKKANDNASLIADVDTKADTAQTTATNAYNTAQTASTNANQAITDVQTLTATTNGLNTRLGAVETTTTSLSSSITSLDTRVSALEQGGGGGGGGGSVSVLDFYPVGSYYETSDSNFNPNTAWGGTWEKAGAGRVTVGSGTYDGTTYTAGTEGGSNTKSHTHATRSHTLSISEIPSHKHNALEANFVESDLLFHTGAEGKSVASLSSGDAHIAFVRESTAVTHSTPYTDTTGGGSSHDHGDTYSASVDVRQAYLVVNRWHRTA